jgi:hypothetical protein
MKERVECGRLSVVLECILMREERDAYRILVGKRLGRWPSGRPKVVTLRCALETDGWTEVV